MVKMLNFNKDNNNPSFLQNNTLMLTLSNEGVQEAVKFENNQQMGSSEDDEQFLERNSSTDTKKDPYNSMANSLINSGHLVLNNDAS